MKKVLLILILLTATLNNSYSQTNYYQYNQYGGKEKTATYQSNYSGGTDKYRYNQYGGKEKVGTYQSEY